MNNGIEIGGYSPIQLAKLLELDGKLLVSLSPSDVLVGAGHLGE